MDRFDRIFRLHTLLSNRRTPIPLTEIEQQLECSKSTADRIIQHLRDFLNAPLEYNREYNGYFYNQTSGTTPYQLPGLWFSAEELHGLLVCQQILSQISPGILSEQIASLQQRINRMLEHARLPQTAVYDKIHFPVNGRRLKDDSHFKRIASALFSNRQMYIQYRARGQNQQLSERRISAQKLLYYRDNWYITAHCHYRKELRMFSIDSIHSVKVLEKNAEQTKPKLLDDFLNSGYGIFSGQAKHNVVLQFSTARANWVADEHWHPKQQGLWLENGEYQLSFPFSDSRELIMDILKHGAEVKVIAPTFLREAVGDEIKKMQNLYDCLTD